MAELKRTVGVVGAVMMGLGSIIGTGVFVSIGIGASVAGAAVIGAILLAACVALLNGLSSAQLAARYPVSGGTYEYGYRVLNPTLGFTAGWTFLLAKSASAATAALGFSGYILHLLNAPDSLKVPLAFGAVVVLTMLCLGGVQRSNRINMVIVSITLAVLLLFSLVGLTRFNAANLSPLFPPDSTPLPAFLQATALMFVAYTGYGRIATLGEEVRDPQSTIPRAIIAALFVTMALYVLVAVASVGSVGPTELSRLTQSAAAPLEGVAQAWGVPGLPLLVTIGAATAMLSVLLNLILGLSRVLLAMGRRHDMPAAVAFINPSSVPTTSILIMGGAIAALVLVGSVKTTWSFSAFTVLIYYSITNLAALRLPPDARRFPAWTSALGLIACLLLAFQVDPSIWLVGGVLIVGGLLWQQIAQRTFAAEHV